MPLIHNKATGATIEASDGQARVLARSGWETVEAKPVAETAKAKPAVETADEKKISLLREEIAQETAELSALEHHEG